MEIVLITGGAGFIGSHLADRLLTQGKAVRVIDNLSTGSRENIAHLQGHERFTFMEGDVCDPGDLTIAMEGVRAVYHLAASVGVKRIMENLISSIHNNIQGTAAVLQEASTTGARVLIASTSEVYGKISEAPSKETDDLRMGDTIKSRWSYACSKALDEYLAFAYYHERGVPVTIVRLFNTVGERQSSQYGMVIPTFVRQALANEPLTIHGDGSQSRCFGYVQDVVWAMHKLMEHPQAIGEIYNIGNPQRVTIDELADRIIAASSSRSEKIYIPYSQAYREGFEDAQRRVPDITKIEQLIGFNPQRNLDDIIRIVASAMQRAPVNIAA